MARRWLKIGAGVASSVTTIIGLFILLSLNFGFVITDLTGDIVCEGTFENPCLSEFDVRNPTPSDVDIFNQDEIKLDFSPEIKDYSLFVKDGRCKTGCAAPNGLQFEGWRFTDFTEATKPRQDKIYVFRFPRYRTKHFLLAGIKNNPNDVIKWGFGVNEEYLDPVWLGKSNEPIIISQQFDKWRILFQLDNESVLFNVTLDQKTEEFCMIPKFATSITREECITNDDNKTTCKDVTYNQPTTVKLTTSKEISQVQKTQDEFCYTLDATESLYYKFGEESIIIVGDTSYDSIDEDVTQETGFAHLSISGVSPYNHLIFYMSFDSNASTTISYDYSNNNNDGTFEGDARYNGSGIFGDGMLLLDGIDDHIEMGTGIGVEFNGTFLAWVKSSDNSGNDYILTQRAGGNSRIYLLGNGNDYVCGFADTHNGLSNNNNLKGDGEWHHMAISYNASFAECYIDGVSIDTYAFELSGINGRVRIGSWAQASAGEFFNGSIDEVMIFNKTFTDAEVLNIFNNQSARFVPLGYQNFTQNVSVGGDGGTENRLNITFTNYKANFSTNISVSVDNGVTYTNLSADGTILELPFTIDPNYLNLTFLYQSGTNQFYTPLMIGNITLDSYTVAVGGTGNKIVIESGKTIFESGKLIWE